MRIARVHKLAPLDGGTEKDPGEVLVDIQPQEYQDDLSLFEDSTKLHKYVVRTKYMIRNSPEYKRMMKFLKHCRGMYCCGVHPNVTAWDGFSINIHHTPLTIEDIIYIVIEKRLKMEEPMKQTLVAKEVMELHYLSLIGLYPLCETCHSYAHGDNNDLFIPLDRIFGNPEAFFDIYNDFITETMKEKFRNLVEMNKGYTIIRREIPDGLIRKYIYVKTKGKEVMSRKALYDFIVKLNQD